MTAEWCLYLNNRRVHTWCGASDMYSSSSSDTTSIVDIFQKLYIRSCLLSRWQAGCVDAWEWQHNDLEHWLNGWNLVNKQGLSRARLWISIWQHWATCVRILNTSKASLSLWLLHRSLLISRIPQLDGVKPPGQSHILSRDGNWMVVLITPNAGSV